MENSSNITPRIIKITPFERITVPGKKDKFKELTDQITYQIRLGNDMHGGVPTKVFSKNGTFTSLSNKNLHINYTSRKEADNQLSKISKVILK